jgi:hypothetical protein
LALSRRLFSASLAIRAVAAPAFYFGVSAPWAFVGAKFVTLTHCRNRHPSRQTHSFAASGARWLRYIGAAGFHRPSPALAPAQEAIG